MSGEFNIFAWQRAVRDSALGAPVKALLFALSTYASSSGEAWPSLDALAQGASLSKSTASRRLGAAEDEGLITRSRRPNRNTVYTLLLPEGWNGHSAESSDCGIRREATPESAEKQLRNPQRSNSAYIRKEQPSKNNPARTTQQQQRAKPQAAAAAVSSSGLELEIQGQVSAGQAEQLKVRWSQALAAAYLSPVPLTEPLLALMTQASAEKLDEALGSLHADVRSPLARTASILSGQAQKPQRAPPPKAGKLWTGGRNSRISPTAINSDDNPYRNSGSPSVWVPPGVAQGDET